MSHLQADAELSVTRALPASASATVNSASIDLGSETPGEFHAECEFEVSAPAVNATMAPDTRTFTYALQDSANNVDFTTVANAVITQTGAASAGAAAQSVRFRAPSTIRRYVRLAITSGASTANASAVSASLRLFT